MRFSLSSSAAQCHFSIMTIIDPGDCLFSSAGENFSDHVTQVSVENMVHSKVKFSRCLLKLM